LTVRYFVSSIDKKVELTLIDAEILAEEILEVRCPRRIESA
jgi:hypothetical protein